MATTHQESVRKTSESMGIPFKTFFYTLEQVADMLNLEVKIFTSIYVHFDARTPGIKKADLFLARNIAPINKKPEWRIADSEVLRWGRSKGFKIVERGWVEN